MTNISEFAKRLQDPGLLMAPCFVYSPLFQAFVKNDVN
jgi:hypothetical protein